VKVLLATWSWRPVGGDWTYIDNLKNLYEMNGYEVIPFSMKHEDNAFTEHEDLFVKGYDYKALNKNKTLKNSLHALKNSVVSFEALAKLDELLQKHEIAFAHLHIIHHWLTPAIVWKLKKHGIPVIWSLHEYKLICPEGSFVSNGTVCEKCYQGKFYNCALNRCKKQSLLASLLASFDAYFYHKSGVYGKVDFYLCPSQFLLNKFSQFGFEPSKLVLSNLCYDISQLDEQAGLIAQADDGRSPASQERFVLYVGRIERIKGVLTLINAVAGTGMKLKIAGTGAALEEMKEYIHKEGITNVEFLGFCSKSVVYRLTMNASCVVCPSEWYENYPYSVIESLLLQKPVVGAAIGGIPELVVDGVTGLLFEPGHVAELRNKLLQLWNDPAQAVQLGLQAREYITGKVNYQRHWSILEGVIKKLPIKGTLPERALMAGVD
jgi:glycosyltransferase involved in cell wall biosynthesis